MKNNLQERIECLSDAIKVGKWEKKLYYLLFSEMIQVNSWKIKAEERVRLCTTFNKVCLNIS
jgi:hypothetical protein